MTATETTTLHGTETLSDAARIMLEVSLDEGDLTLAEAQACVDALRKAPAPMTIASARPYVTDGEWASLSDEQKDELDRAFVQNDVDALINFVGEPLTKSTVKFLQAESAKLSADIAKAAATRMSCIGGFSFNAKKKAYYPQVQINGPVPKGFSDIRHRALSAHQIAITAKLCQDVGADAVLTACREALECVKLAKESKLTTGSFGAASDDAD